MTADPPPRLEAHDALGTTLFCLGDYTAARTHVEQGIALADPTTQRAQVLRNGEASGMRCLGVAANALWCLGYPSQAMQRSQEALALAQELAHPYSLAAARHWAAHLHHRRREVPAVQTQADALLTLATAQGFRSWRGLAPAGGAGRWPCRASARGPGAAAPGPGGHQGHGAELLRPLCLVLLAEAAGHVGQVEEGLRLLADALTALEASGQGDPLAEAYRLQGSLLLRRAVSDATQVEACFQQALTLPAASRLNPGSCARPRAWHGSGSSRASAPKPASCWCRVYGWFTEGFDTADLQEARALLDELS